jgi:hypothetical protein
MLFPVIMHHIHEYHHRRRQEYAKVNTMPYGRFVKQIYLSLNVPSWLLPVNFFFIKYFNAQLAARLIFSRLRHDVFYVER